MSSDWRHTNFLSFLTREGERRQYEELKKKFEK